jgi:cellulose biosynthesis protein BcsQ
MAIICFSSLKGGVGKTTLSLSVACAFAERGCETLLIDMDPAEHASRFFTPAEQDLYQPIESPMARLFLGSEDFVGTSSFSRFVETAELLKIELIKPMRPRMAVLPSGPELRHFLWGRGARAFKALFPRLLEELDGSYDYIFIDTPPDYNVLTRSAIAASNLVVVPVDASVMSIRCLEKLISSCSHIKGPAWSIIRTMVSRQASRVQELSNKRLNERLLLCSGDGREEDDELEEYDELDLEDADSFLTIFDKGANYSELGKTPPMTKPENKDQDESPIYLLNSVVYRTEEQNKLSFLGKTAFDMRSTAKLAQQYLAVARELEQILSYVADAEAMNPEEDFLPRAMEEIQNIDDRWSLPEKLRSNSL